MLDSEVQLENALSAIEVTPEGIVTEVNEVHPLNKLLLIVFNLLDKVALVNDEL